MLEKLDEASPTIDLLERVDATGADFRSLTEAVDTAVRLAA